MRKFATFIGGVLTGVALMIAVRLIVSGPPSKGFEGVPKGTPLRPVHYSCPPGYSLSDFNKDQLPDACVPSDSLPPKPDSPATGR